VFDAVKYVSKNSECLGFKFESRTIPDQQLIRFASEDELDLWIPEDICIERPDLIFPWTRSSS